MFPLLFWDNIFFGVLLSALMPGQICTSFVAARLEVLHDRHALLMVRQLHDAFLLDELQVLKWIEMLLLSDRRMWMCISMYRLACMSLLEDFSFHELVWLVCDTLIPFE